MSGSTGMISGVKIAPTNSFGEQTRKTERAIASVPGSHEAVRRATGVINRIHPKRPRLIKAHGLDGTTLANDAWIELNHSAQEIAERWGTVRIGFRVRVTYSGPAGASADATILGSEGQDIDESFIPNEAQQGLYAVFAPGVGIG